MERENQLTRSSKFARMSAAEMQRRHALLQALSEAQEFDALVTFGNEDDMSGYVRWFVDEPVSSYRTIVMFVPGEGMTVIEHGSAGGVRTHDPKSDDYQGVRAIHTVAAFQSASYTAGYEADVVTGIIRKRGLSRIGLVGMANMPHRFVQQLTDGVEGFAVLNDATDAVDILLAIKSAEEQDHIRAAAALQDEVFAIVLSQLRPGLREIDVTAIARAASLRLGGSGGVILTGSAPQGQFAPFKLAGSQNRIIQEGDYLSLLIENAGPSGHFTEIARNISIGKAGSQLIEASEQSRLLQERILLSMRLEAPCADVFREHNRQRAVAQHRAEDRIFAHGQGYNLVERPLVRDDEPMVLKAGMNLAIHPTLVDTNRYFAVMCDNFLLKDNGSIERIHATSQKVFEV